MKCRICNQESNNLSVDGYCDCVVKPQAPERYALLAVLGLILLSGCAAQPYGSSGIDYNRIGNAFSGLSQDLSQQNRYQAAPIPVTCVSRPSMLRNGVYRTTCQ